VNFMAILFLLILLSIIFYKYVEIYQSMKYEGVEHKKEVYISELISLVIFAVATISLITPSAMNYLKGIV